MSKKPPCYTCKKGDKSVIETEDTIPEWYSKSKNAFSPYLAVPKILVCKDKYKPHPKDGTKKWKEDPPKGNGTQLIFQLIIDVGSITIGFINGTIALSDLYSFV